MYRAETIVRASRITDGLLGIFLGEIKMPKYEHVYRHDHQTVRSLHQELKSYLTFFNRERLHQSPGYATPWDVYRGNVIVAGPDARG